MNNHEAETTAAVSDGANGTAAAKGALRAHYLERRQQLVDAERQTANEAILQHLCAVLQTLPTSGQRRTVGLFRAFRGEVDVFPLLPWLSEHGFSAAVPVVDAERREMVFGAVDVETDWRRGAYGILEPARVQPVVADELCAVLVPGVAFTSQGLRLGYGGGYFDKFFATFPESVARIGVCFQCQVADVLPNEAHDARMHYVVSEGGVLACR